MNRNSTRRYDRTVVLGVERVEAPEVVTSAQLDERLGEVYRRTRMRPGLLEGLVGIRERRWWGEDQDFTDGAVEAGRAALAASGIEPGQVDLLVNTSLSRHWLEPSTAVVIHDALGLSPGCQNFDVTNACLGFMNGMEIAAAMIEAGLIDVALVVDSEDSRPVQESTIRRLSEAGVSSRDLMSEFAALTLGSGAVAMVLARADQHPEGHRLVAGVSRAATEHHELCVGDNDVMRTDLKGLLAAGLDLSTGLWDGAASEFGWDDDITRFFVHQVSQVHTDSICERLKIDPDLVPRSFPAFGNIGPASVAYTLAGDQHSLTRGDRVLLMGIGSGLNASCLEVRW
ncbi:3-oxoacyl-ACP synthase III [Nocardioides sp. SYSU D00065]|uniref:3-oxoacyl-ACP synthase III n=1 Tax=Nocardioides sp. SYSU D00065 TaxID=2817378 RepID=UPI001B319C00|nr:3-oxoacyl-ACP synthase III [Nocardioides sp. SYSU D00065]